LRRFLISVLSSCIAFSVGWFWLGIRLHFSIFLLPKTI
jgi:hypothetical protein